MSKEKVSLTIESMLLKEVKKEELNLSDFTEKKLAERYGYKKSWEKYEKESE